MLRPPGFMNMCRKAPEVAAVYSAAANVDFGAKAVFTAQGSPSSSALSSRPSSAMRKRASLSPTGSPLTNSWGRRWWRRRALARGPLRLDIRCFSSSAQGSCAVSYSRNDRPSFIRSRRVVLQSGQPYFENSSMAVTGGLSSLVDANIRLLTKRCVYLMWARISALPAFSWPNPKLRITPYPPLTWRKRAAWRTSTSRPRSRGSCPR